MYNLFLIPNLLSVYKYLTNRRILFSLHTFITLTFIFLTKTISFYVLIIIFYVCAFNFRHLFVCSRYSNIIIRISIYQEQEVALV